jgi:hypothetical protein
MNKKGLKKYRSSHLYLSFQGVADLCTDTHRVHRVATAAFWRTFSDEGKISPGW